jgi:hypothetical protein
MRALAMIGPLAGWMFCLDKIVYIGFVRYESGKK